MAKEDVEREYELVPVSPIEELRREISSLKRSSVDISSDRVAKDMIDLVKSNQEIVNKLISINREVIGKVDTLVNSLQELLDIMKVAAQEMARDEKTQTVDLSPLADKFGQLITQNETVINQLNALNKTMKEKIAEAPAEKPLANRFNLPTRTAYSYPSQQQSQFSQFLPPRPGQSI